MRLLNKKKKWRKFRNPKRKLKTSFFLIGIVVLFIFQFLFFVLGFQTKNLPKKKKTIVWTPEIHLFFIVIIICVHWFPPFFFLADWPVRRFTRHESFVFGTNCVCLSILERERERNTNRTWNRIKITPFLFFFSFLSGVVNEKVVKMLLLSGVRLCPCRRSPKSRPHTQTAPNRQEWCQKRKDRGEE
jgi:hypothetical protein